MTDSFLIPGSLGLFDGFSAEELEMLANLFVLIETPSGTILFEQGDMAENIFLVVSGEVTVRYKPEDGPALIVTRLHKEGVVGWSAVIGSPTYTSSAVCISDCALLKASSEDLRRFVERQPAAGSLLLERLATLIAVRMRNTHGHVMALLQQGMGLPASHSSASV